MPRKFAKRKSTKSPQTVQPRPNFDELVRLVGDLDDAVLLAILDTGATYLEIGEAANAAAGGADDLERLRRALSPNAEAVYDILTSEPAFTGNDRER